MGSSLAQSAPTRIRSYLGRSKPLWDVAGWEARRLVASPYTWLVVLAVFGIFSLIMASRVGWSTWGFGDGIVNLQADIPYGSVMSIYYDLPFDLIFPLVLVVVFLVSDGVARDWHRRTHELVMATALPTWAYVWGRYLVVTALSLFFAFEMLAAIVFLITIEHTSIGGADYPAAQIGPVLAPWAAMVLPATIFAGGLGFALGTLLFQHTTYVKLAIALGWFMWLIALPGIVQGNPDVPEWLLRWEPTYVGLRTGLYDLYDSVFHQSVTPLERSGHPISHGQLLTIYHHLIYELPDTWSWLPAHLIWATGAVGVVGLAAYLFKRYQNAVR
jgi:ABC-type transport system involved in multi-copper enzyme maturation permease subunit